MSDAAYTTKNSSSVRNGELLRPAFTTNTQALCFLALVVFALVFPVLISEAGLISRRNSYEIMPENKGGFSFAMNETFDNKEDIDLLFVGSSVAFQGIDTPQVQKGLSSVLGRPARVMTFGHYFNSVDISYMQIRDLLERKRVRMIVLSIPRITYTEGPSPIACKFIRYSDDKEIFDGLPLKSKVSLYGCSVLRAPTDLLTMMRPNQSKPSPFAENLGADKQDFGWARVPETFERFTPVSPSVPGDKMIYSSETKEQFHFTNEEITYHQNYYLEKLLVLLKHKNVPVMMLNIPQHTERFSPKVVERKDWSKSFDMDIPLVGVAPPVLFAGLSAEEIDKLYFDPNHFNTNGNEFYTSTVLPAILEVYKRHATKN